MGGVRRGSGIGSGRRRCRGALLGVLALTVGALVTGPAAAAHDVPTERVAGADRSATAAAVAAAAFPEGARVALLVRDDGFADGLTAAPLAAQMQAPVLLTATDGVPAATWAALDDLGVSEVVLLGGTAAISDAVAADLAEVLAVDRVAGPDRYATAAAVARRIAAAGAIGTVETLRTVFVASGATFPDALAAGAAAAADGAAPLPVLLTDPQRLPTATTDAVADLAVEQAIVVGGAAAVAPAVADTLTAAGLTVHRLAGADRQATAARVADFTIAHSDATGARVLLARGDAFPDALTAGVYAGRTDAPIVLTRDPDRLGTNTSGWFDSACLLIDTVEAVGGTAAVADAVLAAAADTAAGCHGTWGTVPDAPFAPRSLHSATWTGAQMLVWGGLPEVDGPTLVTDDGAGWDPARREWRSIPAAPITARWSHDAFWTGRDLLVWGGTEGPDDQADCFSDGARYDPGAGTWRTVAAAPGGTWCAPSTVWTGGEMIVFGGFSANPPPPGSIRDDAVAYDPVTDTWRTLPAAPLAARVGAVTVWTGTDVVVAGGSDADFTPLGDAAAYTPATDAWRTIPDLPEAVGDAEAGVWTGDEVIVLGRPGGAAHDEPRFQHAAAYDPTADRWRSLADPPMALQSASLVRADDRLLALGPDGDVADGPPALLTYRPATDTWTRQPDPPGGGPRSTVTPVWTGSELLVWGAAPSPTGVSWRPPLD